MAILGELRGQLLGPLETKRPINDGKDNDIVGAGVNDGLKGFGFVNLRSNGLQYAFWSGRCWRGRLGRRPLAKQTVNRKEVSIFYLAEFT